MAITVRPMVRSKRAKPNKFEHESPRIAGQRWFTPYVFMLPGLVLFVFMFAWPAFISFQLSVSRYDIIHPISYVGLDNFARLFTDQRFHHALLNSFLFLIMYLPLAVVVPLLLAILVNRKIPGIQTFRVLYYLPVVTSMVAVAVAWRYVFSQEGVVSWMLTAGGLLDKPVSFLLDPHWALPSVVLIEGWKSIGLYMMIYLAGLQAVPPELNEAAKVDGANALQRVWHITTPAMVPYIAVALTLGMLDSMRSFESIYVLTQGGPQDATLTLGYYVWQTAFQNYDMGYASAVGLVMWAIMIGLALLNQLVTRRR